MGKFKFRNKLNQKRPNQLTPTNEGKGSEKIFKFNLQVVRQQNNYATFATVKEKIIHRAQVELKQGHNVKVALETNQNPNFDTDKPHLDIIDIEEIMAENDDVDKDKAKFYTPTREPTEKEKRKLDLVQERYNKAFDNAFERFEARKETFKENMKKIYMKIFDKYCTPTMQNRLQQHPKFATNCWTFWSNTKMSPSLCHFKINPIRR